MPFVNDYFVLDADGDIEKQAVVGEFSVTKDRHVVLDSSRKRYLNERLVQQKECSLDLSDGFGTYECWEENYSSRNMDVLLEYIMKRASPKRNLLQACCNSDLVCCRGVLTRIASYPFDHQDGLVVAAVRYKSMIFLCQFDTEERIDRSKQNPDSDLCTYFGYKFEQYATSEMPHGQPDTTEPVNNMEQYSLAFDTCFKGKKNVRIFSSGEIDCFDHKGKPIELKTEKIDAKKGFYHMIKYLKWSNQCYFAGINEVILGFRDGSVLKRVQRLPVGELCGDKVKARTMRSFLYNTLLLIKQELDSEGNLEYFLVTFRCQGYKILRPHITPAPSKYHFLPQYFLDHFC